MKKCFALAALTLVLSAMMYAQQSLSGMWQGSTPSGRPLALDLKAKGGALTGALTLAQNPVEISDGKIDGKKFSFVAPAEGRTVEFNGELVGDEMKLMVQGIKDPITLKRAKPSKSRK